MSTAALSHGAPGAPPLRTGSGGDGDARARTRALTEMTAWAGIAGSIVALVLTLAAPWPWLAFTGVLVLACVPAGAAIMCRFDAGNAFAQAGLTLALSLAVFSIVSVAMIWLAAWAPDALLAIPVLSLVSCRSWQLNHEEPTGIRLGSAETAGLGRHAAVLLLGTGAWAYGASRLTRSTIGLYGLLPSVDGWFLVGLVLLLAGCVLELRRDRPRTWLLGLYLVALVVAIHATVPILYGTPEYAWVYKHIGIVQALGVHGRITDPSNIYEQWPLLFAAAAAVSALGHIGPLSWTTWAPVGFELAFALVVLGVFRLLAAERRSAYLALLLYIGLISWVGQDYFSPQAFGYLLWLAIVLISVRWLRTPPPEGEPVTRLQRLRAPLLHGLPAPPQTSARMRAVATALVAVLYFAIVAAHQLTPYLGLAAVTSLVLLDVIGPRWLPLLLAAIAFGYLAPHYGTIAHDFGGLFSGGNPIQNASGSRGTHHAGPQALTAWIVRGLAACMWLGALAVIARWRRAPSRVLLPAVLAFSPFVVLLAQRYGGEAIYRVYLFSAPWCALLIAEQLCHFGLPQRHGLLTLGVCAVTVFAGLQGLYSPVALNAVTPAELAASRWLYEHSPRGSLIVLPVDDFPVLETADYNAYKLQVMPSDPQMGQAWLDESNLGDIESWIASLGYDRAYVPFSRAMAAYAEFFGDPRAYAKLAGEVVHAAGWSVIHRNSDVTIYRLDLASAAAAAAPVAAAQTPAPIITARANSRSRTARTKARGKLRLR